jgi:hypothetical protein
LIKSHRIHPIFSLGMGYHMPRWSQVVTVRCKKNFDLLRKAAEPPAKAVAALPVT